MVLGDYFDMKVTINPYEYIHRASRGNSTHPWWERVTSLFLLASESIPIILSSLTAKPVRSASINKSLEISIYHLYVCTSPFGTQTRTIPFSQRIILRMYRTMSRSVHVRSSSLLSYLYLLVVDIRSIAALEQA